jgi:hypothetical protein
MDSSHDKKVISIIEHKLKRTASKSQNTTTFKPESEIIENEGLKRAALELFHWQYRDGTNFTSQLFSLLAKSDIANQGRFMQGFPDEVIVFTMWKTSEKPEIFFDMFGIKLNNL